MAFIYRYRLKNKKFEGHIDLREESIEKDIIKHLIYVFNENLKEYKVKNEIFEFKLYESVDNSTLRRLGRALETGDGYLKLSEKIEKQYKEAHIENKELPIYESNEEVKDIRGFIRMPQEFYAVSYPIEAEVDEKDKKVYVEFFDTIDIDEDFMIRAKQYTKKYWDKYSEKYWDEKPKGENGSNISSKQKVENAFYIDILSTKLDYNNSFLKGNELSNINFFKVKGYHRASNNNEDMGKIKIANVIEEPYLEYRNKYKYKEKNNYLHIVSFDKATKNDIDNIKRILENINYEVDYAEEISEAKNIKKSDKLTFTVHNVGQALMTSLSKDGKKVLYFDFGMGEGENYITNPANIVTGVNKDSAIILSHIHRDHWMRLTEEREAFRCSWYIPNQTSEASFKSKFAEIIVLGGDVKRIVQTININCGVIFCGCKSLRKANRVAKDKHETGLSLRLEVSGENNNEINILVAGDQNYDYMDSVYTSSIDILVASHHGGTYSWSNRKGVYSDIPIPQTIDNSIVVYSYGLNNTYGHPSKKEDYKRRGWKNEYDTATSGDYILNLIVK